MRLPAERDASNVRPCHSLIVISHLWLARLIRLRRGLRKVKRAAHVLSPPPDGSTESPASATRTARRQTTQHQRALRREHFSRPARSRGSRSGRRSLPPATWLRTVIKD